MKFSLGKIKNPLKKKDSQGPNAINPHKHWIKLLYGFFIIVACLVLFSLYLLYQIKNDHIFQVKPTLEKNNTLLKEDLLKKVNDSFDQKAQKESELKTNPPSYPDPSL
jgi:hypothetical protein